MPQPLQPIRSTAVVPYDPAWAAAYQAAAAEIAAVLGAELVAIHHAGSTAIPGIRAKPIIDLVVEVRQLDAMDAAAEALGALGYVAWGEHGIPLRRFFTKSSGPMRTHNLHSFPIGHPEIRRMLNFRDYLWVHPDDAQAYSQLKQDLARRFPTDIESYTLGKTVFIEEIVRRAEAWRARNEEAGGTGDPGAT
jgi:GrpB-like predicted nucleotidyltransferase (UPF0157 family)